MIDRKYIGTESPPRTVTAETGRIRLFAKAIGETNPIYSDDEAARSAGYRGIVAPPTFVHCLGSMDVDDPFARYKAMGIDLGKVLHGEQHFEYHAPVCAGDELTFRAKISDIYEKKHGALEFLVTDTAVTNQNDELVANIRGVTVVRNR